MYDGPYDEYLSKRSVPAVCLHIVINGESNACHYKYDQTVQPIDYVHHRVMVPLHAAQRNHDDREQRIDHNPADQQ